MKQPTLNPKGLALNWLNTHKEEKHSNAHKEMIQFSSFDYDSKTVLYFFKFKKQVWLRPLGDKCRLL